MRSHIHITKRVIKTPFIQLRRFLLRISFNIALQLWSLQPDIESVLLSNLTELSTRGSIDQSLDIGITHLTNSFF